MHNVKYLFKMMDISSPWTQMIYDRVSIHSEQFYSPIPFEENSVYHLKKQQQAFYYGLSFLHTITNYILFKVTFSSQ